MYVGVILKAIITIKLENGVPHVCGGDPTPYTQWFERMVVFPMYVGVILGLHLPITEYLRVPHVCGGDPQAAVIAGGTSQCSPCMWG